MKTAYERLENFGDYFGISQLMSILDNSDSTVRRLIKNKKVQCYFTSNTYYFKKENVESFVAEGGL